MPKLTFLGHSGWLIEGQHNIVIDPFLSGNPVAKHTAEDIKADFILLSHAHGDHVGDTEAIAKKNSAKIISNNEIAMYYAAKDYSAHPLHIGGGNTFPFGRVKLTPAWHGSAFPDGTYGGMPAGILLTVGNKTIYHTGDTGLFLDMELIGKHHKVDLMLVCIGDNFTMGIDDAVEAVSLVKPELVIPMHYNTFDLVAADPQEFVEKISANGFKGKIMNPGDVFEF